MRTASNRTAFTIAALAACSLALSACASDSTSTATIDPGPGSVGISQGGAQDFGLFRQILENGQIPGPGALDAQGFFAEHKLDYPAPDCGHDVCMHGLLGVMGNLITGSTCTLIQVGMNSPLDPSTIARPPLNLVIAVDTSGSMAGDPITYVKLGLAQMIASLKPEDHVSLVTYSSAAHVDLDYVEATDVATLEKAFGAIAASGSTNLYDGLFTAFSLADAHLDPTHQNRIIYLSDGVATTGITSEAKLRALAAGYAKKGIGITTVGVGKDFDVGVMRGLGEIGAGNFYFLEDPKAVKEVFTDEVKTFLVPVALDVKLEVAVGAGYDLRAVYGTRGFAPGEGGGTVAIPSLFLAGRTSADEPIQTGRRGGGGAMLFELMPKANQTGVANPLSVGGLSLSYTDPVKGLSVSEKVTIAAPTPPNAPPKDGYFSDTTVEKGFVMLNIYAGFALAAQLASDSDPRTARRTLEALRPNVDAWLQTTPDPDLTDDLHYVDLFIANLKVAEQSAAPYEPADPPEPWPAD